MLRWAFWLMMLLLLDNPLVLLLSLQATLRNIGWAALQKWLLHRLDSIYVSVCTSRAHMVLSIPVCCSVRRQDEVGSWQVHSWLWCVACFAWTRACDILLIRSQRADSVTIPLLDWKHAIVQILGLRSIFVLLWNWKRLRTCWCVPCTSIISAGLNFNDLLHVWDFRGVLILLQNLFIQSIDVLNRGLRGICCGRESCRSGSRLNLIMSCRRGKYFTLLSLLWNLLLFAHMKLLSLVLVLWKPLLASGWWSRFWKLAEIKLHDILDKVLHLIFVL